MSALGVALGLLFAGQEPAGLDAGLAALREGRYQDAARLLDAATAVAPSYDGLLALGLARGRLGDYAGAGAALDAALARDAARPEAWVERGGLRFLEGRYAEAVQDLERALGLAEDTYTRDLLASSLHLAGRGEDALARWNVLGRPQLGQLDVRGLVHTRDRVLRRELAVAEGELLDLDRLRESRLRLAELGIFDRVTLRPMPREDGRADLQVAVVERHGLSRSLMEFVVTTGAHALGRRVRLRYTNAGGRGISFGGQYRWQATRPEVSLALAWPRPLGMPGVLHMLGVRGRQTYDLDGTPFVRRSRGLDLGLRRVLGARTTGLIGIRRRERSFSRVHPDARPGTFLGLDVGLERRLLDRHRQRLDGTVRYFRAVETLGGEFGYGRAVAGLTYRASLSPPDGSAVEPSVLAVQLRLGRGDAGMPLDEAFAPGGSLEMDLPLRARRQTRRGILGPTPIGRSLGLWNVEWRRRLFESSFLQVGAVAFYDGAWMGRVVGSASEARFHDVGAGLRVALRGSPVIRVDFGRGLTDGRNALFIGLNQVF